MAANTESRPVLSILSSAESIYLMRRKYRFALVWTIISSIWLISMATLFTVFIIVAPNLKAIVALTAVVIVIVLGIPLFITTPFAIFYSRKTFQELDSFLSDFFPLWIRLKFELLPSEGSNTRQRLMKKVEELMPSFVSDSVGPKLSSKKTIGDPRFDIGLKKDRKLILAKIITHNGSASKKEFEEVTENALSLSKRLKLDLALLLIVVHFTIDQDITDAIQHNDQFKKMKTTIVALREDGDHFQVESLSTFSLAR